MPCRGAWARSFGVGKPGACRSAGLLIELPLGFREYVACCTTRARICSDVAVSALRQPSSCLGSYFQAFITHHVGSAIAHFYSPILRISFALRASGLRAGRPCRAAGHDVDVSSNQFLQIELASFLFCLTHVVQEVFISGRAVQTLRCGETSDTAPLADDACASRALHVEKLQRLQLLQLLHLPVHLVIPIIGLQLSSNLHLAGPPPKSVPHLG
mmetsp:Transcript_76460/g.144015  ORF Transcript_76460/g.144015 Transcript_76460/m.144015 type:complete len:214 (+) Transcript_76460:832-1473(+)